jgi:GNAT superfamily N-acetyltransferase
VAAGPCRDDDRPRPHQGEIYACYVRPGWWRRGAGRLLFAHATSVLAQAGQDDVTLWLLEANRAARRMSPS